MGRIVMADDGIAFDGAMAERAPLGGAETAFVGLAEAFASRGHSVAARNRCLAPVCHKGVDWAPLASGVPESCDLYIGNRGHRVISLAPRARRRLFWLHNPAGYLRKPRNWLPLARFRPILVVSGTYHASTIPPWLPRGGCAVIPYGLLDRFRHAVPRQPPPPYAIFTSNPLRGLDWLLDLWRDRIAPSVPGAELHIYGGPGVYGGAGWRRASDMNAILARAERMGALGIRRHPPVSAEALAAALSGARVMLYRGDPGETFCLALAEAQAMGLPAIVQPLGAVGERIIDGQTGSIAADRHAFAEAAITVLRDDALWRRWHLAALENQRGLSWDAVAAQFEELMP